MIEQEILELIKSIKNNTALIKSIKTMVASNSGDIRYNEAISRGRTEGVVYRVDLQNMKEAVRSYGMDVRANRMAINSMAEQQEKIMETLELLIAKAYNLDRR